MRKLGLLVWKDVVSEARSLERTLVLALFAGVILTTLHFSLPPGSDVRPAVAGGFLWTAIVFATLLEVRRSFETERTDGTLDGLRAAPVDTVLVFASKALASTLVLGLLACVLVPVVAVMFAGRAAGIAPAIGVAVAGVVGLVAWGTLLGCVAGGTRAADAVLPLLLFPLVVPQTIGCVRLLSHYLAGAGPAEPLTGFVLLGAFDVLAWGTSLLLFDYVLDE